MVPLGNLREGTYMEGEFADFEAALPSVHPSLVDTSTFKGSL